MLTKFGRRYRSLFLKMLSKPGEVAAATSSIASISNVGKEKDKPWRIKMLEFLDDPSSSRWAYYFAQFVTACIFLSVTAMCMSTVKDPYYKVSLDWELLDLIFFSLFSVELLLRIICKVETSERGVRLNGLMTDGFFWLDFVAVLPYWLTKIEMNIFQKLGNVLRALSVLRLLKLSRCGFFPVLRAFAFRAVHIGMVMLGGDANLVKSEYKSSAYDLRNIFIPETYPLFRTLVARVCCFKLWLILTQFKLVFFGDVCLEHWSGNPLGESLLVSLQAVFRS